MIGKAVRLREMMFLLTALTVSEYIASQPAVAQAALVRIRAVIRKALPAAQESISYGMPTYKVGGKPVLYFAGWKKHYSLYPVSARLMEAIGEELTSYQVNKGTIRFPLTEPVPAKLIERIARFRVKEIANEDSLTVQRNVHP